ncbi:Uncharacterized protein APZ42_013841 [Daphnia magna]|uniref:Uncharacterized protein n=1 Tax=Daphnia magna TaxID=35525 RepID=A0A162QGP2_9CRUS|nr:Uncharacterized protein APZ42_013841 [Daphnia magna]
MASNKTAQIINNLSQGAIAAGGDPETFATSTGRNHSKRPLSADSSLEEDQIEKKICYEDLSSIIEDKDLRLLDSLSKEEIVGKLLAAIEYIKLHSSVSAHPLPFSPSMRICKPSYAQATKVQQALVLVASFAAGAAPADRVSLAKMEKLLEFIADDSRGKIQNPNGKRLMCSIRPSLNRLFSCLQVNLRHSKVASASLAEVILENNLEVILIQEPFSKNQKSPTIMNIPLGCVTFHALTYDHAYVVEILVKLALAESFRAANRSCRNHVTAGDLSTAHVQAARSSVHRDCTVSPRCMPWWRKELCAMRNRARRAFKLWSREKTYNNKVLYSTTKANYQRELRRAKKLTALCAR